MNVDPALKGDWTNLLIITLKPTNQNAAITCSLTRWPQLEGFLLILPVAGKCCDVEPK